ncbi:type II toxin-antitoxin system YoeB family toxin [Clostridium sp. 001]|nr:type II toxin-antitoxin system YoeB family toxin [Clostridium sp. 001]QXE21235.1 hypothetical protein B5S50_09400 [Clostridium sp. 001]
MDLNRYYSTGKPELLNYELQGFWSRRFDDVNHLVYHI